MLIALSWATRIRTLKMLESESSALPFGDSPSQGLIIYYVKLKCKHYFKKINKKVIL